MPDREKVITGLELCTNISPDGCLMLCPYKDEKDETYSGFCEQVLKQDALNLLKEQEAKKVIESTNIVRCDDCEYSFCEGFVRVRLYCEKHPELGEIKGDWFCADCWKA